MLNKLRPVATVLGLGLVAGCTAGNGAQSPPFTSTNLNSTKLQLAVGVATFTDGTTGLNVVSTFRQANGLAGTLLNTPTLTGPFTVPAGVPGTRSAATTFTFGTAICGANVDGGSDHVTGSLQVLPGSTATCTTFGQAGGILSSGFAPANSTTAQAPSFLLYGDFLDGSDGAIYGAPFYGDPTLESDGAGDEVTDEDGDPLGSGAGYAAFRGGPPAYPNVQNGTYPSGFIGYTFGYTTFAMPPVAGNYGLSVQIQSANTAGGTISANAATLTNVAGLPPFAAPAAFAEDGTGGGTASCTAPAGVTETIVELFNEKTDAYFTQVVQGGGAVSVTFADALGPAPANGAPAPTLNVDDPYEVTCIGADYPLFESGPPANTTQTPTLVGTAGQADIVFDIPFTSAAYADEDAKARRPALHHGIRHASRRIK